MKIEGKDAQNVYSKPVPPPQQQQTQPQQVKVVKPQEAVHAEAVKKVDDSELLSEKHISDMTHTDMDSMPVAEKAIIQAIERANKVALGRSTSFRFSVHEATKRISVTVLDRDTNEVIREIPPEKVLDMVAKLWEMAGIIVDERR